MTKAIGLSSFMLTAILLCAPAQAATAEGDPPVGPAQWEQRSLQTQQEYQQRYFNDRRESADLAEKREDQREQARVQDELRETAREERLRDEEEFRDDHYDDRGNDFYGYRTGGNHRWMGGYRSGVIHLND